MISKPIIYKSFKDFNNHRKKTNRAVVFSHTPFSNFLKFRDHQWDLPTIWKTRLLRHILKTSTCVHERSGPQFFRTTTGIRSEADVLHNLLFLPLYLDVAFKKIWVVVSSYWMIWMNKYTAPLCSNKKFSWQFFIDFVDI